MEFAKLKEFVFASAFQATQVVKSKFWCHHNLKVLNSGIDCGSAVKSKVAAWWPLDANTLDMSGNNAPLFVKVSL